MATGEAQPEPEPSARPSRFWLWAVVVVVIVAIVGAVIGVSLGSRQGGPLAGQNGGSDRPAIVVPTPQPASSVSPAPSPSLVPPTVVAGATPLAPPGASTEYVVQPGDTLRSIALEQYGDAEQWQRIYQANRDTIGANPDALVAGTKLQLPPAQ